MQIRGSVIYEINVCVVCFPRIDYITINTSITLPKHVYGLSQCTVCTIRA